MKRAIVTGANGFIGSSFVKVLLEKGVNVVAIDISFAAPKSKSNTKLSFRLDGSAKMTATFGHTAESIKISNDDKEAIKLFIMGNHSSRNWIYEAEISSSTKIKLADIKASAVYVDASGGKINFDPILDDCKMWIEKDVDGLTYAKKADTFRKITEVDIEEVSAPVRGGIRHFGHLYKCWHS